MIKTKVIIFVILLFLILPGCLARYGEGRLEQLLTSVNNLQRESEENNEELTEEKIREILGEPGLLKPIYERNLEFSFLDKLKEDSGVLLMPNRVDLYDDMLTDIKKKEIKERKSAFVYL